MKSINHKGHKGIEKDHKELLAAITLILAVH
jgi:hypothetical protein